MPNGGCPWFFLNGFSSDPAPSYFCNYPYIPYVIDYRALKYTYGRSDLIFRKSTNYYYDKNENLAGTVETREEFDYEPFNYQLREHRTYLNDNSQEQEFIKVYKYPYNLLSNTDGQGLYNKHRLNEVLEEYLYKDGKLLSVRRNEYSEFPVGSGNWFLSKVKTGKFSGNTLGLTKQQIQQQLEDRLEYVEYDDRGNPLELRKAEGLPVSYIWGYSQAYPVAKIEGASLGEVKTALGINPSQPIDLGASGLTPSQESALRNNLTGALITTYDYKPLVGITKITDPRGKKTTYHYGSFNRLKEIRDENGNIIEDYDYNYRPTTITP